MEICHTVCKGWVEFGQPGWKAQVDDLDSKASDFYQEIFLVRA